MICGFNGAIMGLLAGKNENFVPPVKCNLCNSYPCRRIVKGMGGACSAPWVGFFMVSLNALFYVSLNSFFFFYVLGKLRINKALSRSRACFFMCPKIPKKWHKVPFFVPFSSRFRAVCACKKKRAALPELSLCLWSILGQF